jgi:choline-sulfatase
MRAVRPASPAASGPGHRLPVTSSLAACLLTLMGCGTTGAGEPGRRGDPATHPPAVHTHGPSTAEGAGAGRPVRVHYDLTAHPKRVELREGRTLVVNLGTDAAGAYTMGGWRSGVAPATLDGTPVGAVTGTRGTLWVPWDGEGGAVLTVRGRALAKGPVAFHWNGEPLESEALPRDGFGVLRFTLPEGALQRGDNVLTVRARRLGQLDEGRRASVAIDWLRIGPASEGHRDGAPPDATGLFQAGRVPSMRVPGGMSLGWTFRVPEGARVRGVAKGPGRVRLEAHTDAGPGRPLCDMGTGSIDCPLGDLAGQVIRLELAARGGDVTLLAPAVTVPGSETGAGAPPARPKHVLLYLVDTLRADKLAPYQPDTRVQTPGLVRFAEGAATFHNARAPENWTKPSVATLLSSLMPWEHTAQDGRSVLPASVTLLPERLAEEGFFTGSFIANGYVSDRFGFKQGWNTYRNYIRESRRTASEYVASDVIGWLDRRPQDQPFFLYVHTIDPHVPYRPREPFLGTYGDAAYRGPVTFRRDATLLEKIKTGKLRLRPADKAHLEALYDGEISYHDVHFTAILDALEERGLADDTLVIVTSDHGEEFWDHGSVGHGHNMYDELLRVPFLIRLPGVAGGTSIRTHVGLVDVVPTVLDALGMPIPEDVAGRSLLPLLEGRQPTVPPATVSAFLDNWRSVAVDDLKLLQRADVEGRLYDLTTDAAEQEDVAADRPISLRHARAALGLSLQDHDAVAATQARRAPRRARPRHRRQQTDLDDETKAQLRALGYIH